MRALFLKTRVREVQKRALDIKVTNHWYMQPPILNLSLEVGLNLND